MSARTKRRSAAVLQEIADGKRRPTTSAQRAAAIVAQRQANWAESQARPKDLVPSRQVARRFHRKKAKAEEAQREYARRREVAKAMRSRPAAATMQEAAE